MAVRVVKRNADAQERARGRVRTTRCLGTEVALRRQGGCSGLAESAGQTGEHGQIDVQCHPLNAAHSQRQKPPLVLQHAKTHARRHPAGGTGSSNVASRGERGCGAGQP